MSTCLNLGPGLHDGIPAEAYHADPCPMPSLSSGVARTIVGDSLAHAYLAHPRLGGKKDGEATEAMDLGSLVHALLADEANLTCEIGNFDTYRSKAAQEWRDEVRRAGKTPVLEKVAEQAKPIVEALRSKAGRGLTIDPFSAGKAEVTAVWREGEAYCRARYDRLILDSYADIWDWKTTTSIAPHKLMRSIVDQGYHIQAAMYRRGLMAIRPDYAGRCSFILVFVEVSPPYAVRRVVLSEAFLQIGGAEVSRAILRWQHATATNEWPEGAGDTLELTPPNWLTAQYMESETT